MIRFWVFYILVSYVGYKALTARKTKELERMQVEERWSELRIVVSEIALPFLNILGLLLIIFVVLPLSKDLPNATRGNYLTHTGNITSIECKYKCQKQTIVLGDEQFKAYFFKDFREGQSYEVRYLPESKFITKVIPAKVE